MFIYIYTENYNRVLHTYQCSSHAGQRLVGYRSEGISIGPVQDRFWHVGARPYGHEKSNDDKTTLVAFQASLRLGCGICDSDKLALADISTRSTSTEGREWRRGGTLAALCSSVPQSSTENTLHVKIYDNLLHSLSDLNDTTCPWPLRGTVADLAAFVVAGGALSCSMTAGGVAGDDGAVGLATFDLRWRCGLSIYHDRFTCLCVIVLSNFIGKCILCISIE